MTDVSIELVPRSLESIAAELETVNEHFPAVRTVNIPDLLRFELRSWTASSAANARMERAIPHLRAMDFDLKRPLRLLPYLQEHRLDELLVVQGDPPQDLSHPVYPTTSVELIAALKTAWPEVRIYAALDPYRSGVRQELAYAHAKREAGACGFFTQPFFDLRLLDLWGDLLAGERVYWGVSPVLSRRTRRYWETKNRAFFPPHFHPTLEWNRHFAAEALAWVRQRRQDVYFMPLRSDLCAWLDGVL